MLWHTHTACLCFLLCAAVNARAVCVGHEYLTIMGCTLMLNYVAVSLFRAEDSECCSEDPPRRCGAVVLAPPILRGP